MPFLGSEPEGLRSDSPTRSWESSRPAYDDGGESTDFGARGRSAPMPDAGPLTRREPAERTGVPDGERVTDWRDGRTESRERSVSRSTHESAKSMDYSTERRDRAERTAGSVLTRERPTGLRETRRGDSGPEPTERFVPGDSGRIGGPRGGKGGAAAGNGRPGGPRGSGSGRAATADRSGRASMSIGTGRSAAARIAARQPVLTGVGVVALSAFLCLIGGLVDVLTADRLGACYAACFVAASAYGAWRVGRSTLTTALLAPPLVFAGTSLVLLQLLPDAGGSGPVHEVLRLAASLATQGPVVWMGTLASAAIVAYRWQQLRAHAAR